jgi:hypothetical protein
MVMQQPKRGRPKGLPKTGGRKPGVANKATLQAREAIAAFVDNNSARLQHLLDRIEVEDGARAAFECIVDLLEYHVPKLARTELTGKDGKDLALVQAAAHDESL